MISNGPQEPEEERPGEAPVAGTVPCPGCGRGYGAGRFATGRSLQCACGARVGLRRETGIGREERPRFLADVMLGGLARWLRALGYDTAWEAEIADDELVRRGLEERRMILTRDTRLVEEWWLDALVRVSAEAPLEQLREVADRFGLSAGAVFTRCLRCNVPLEPVSREEAAGRVPPDVLAGPGEIRRCPRCGRLYWEGSHTARMRQEIARALGDEAAP